jgi:hypothetical protein
VSSTNDTLGVPAFDLRLAALDQSVREEPYALVVGVAHSGVVTELAAGTRREMKDLRNRLLIELRAERGPLEALASALARVARSLPAVTTGDRL